MGNINYRVSTLSWRNFGRAVASRLVRVIISFAIVTIGFLVTDTPILATGAATLAWALTGMFLSISSCLLTSGDK